MNKYILPNFLLIVMAFFFLSGCEGNRTEQSQNFEVITAEDLAGTYTGVLEGVTVPSLGSTDDRSQQVIVDVDLLHEVTMEDMGGMSLVIESAIIPRTRAIVAGIGSFAINLEFVEFEGLDLFEEDHEIHALQVKQMIFVKHNEEWVFVLQIARVGFDGEKDLDGVYVYQYVSYPPSTAEQMSEDETNQYVNTILRLASEAQRD
jgi:hypothetical protein